MFDEILEEGARWSDGTVERADVILWCTGFRSALDHLAPLGLRGPDGGIAMAGRLATQVAADLRIHLAVRPLGVHHRCEPRRRGGGAGACGSTRASLSVLAEICKERGYEPLYRFRSWVSFGGAARDARVRDRSARRRWCVVRLRERVKDVVIVSDMVDLTHPDLAALLPVPHRQVSSLAVRRPRVRRRVYRIMGTTAKLRPAAMMRQVSGPMPEVDRATIRDPEVARANVEKHDSVVRLDRAPGGARLDWALSSPKQP